MKSVFYFIVSLAAAIFILQATFAWKEKRDQERSQLLERADKIILENSK